MLSDADRKALHDSLMSPDAGGDDGELLAYLKVLQDATSIAQPGSSIRKNRYLCLVDRPDKIQLCKVKRTSKGFAVGKTWSVDEVRRLKRDKSHRFMVELDKPYSWSVDKDKEQEMMKFLAMLFDTCCTVQHSPPKLVNLTERELQQYLSGEAESRRPVSLDNSTSPLPTSTHISRSQTYRVDLRNENAGGMRSNTISYPKGSNSGPTGRDSKDREKDERRERDRAKEIKRERERKEKKALQEREKMKRDAELKAKLAEQASLMNVEELLTDFNWKASGNAAALEKRLLGELQALEAANVHAIIQSDERVRSVIEHIDGALTELEGMESWLSLYSAELNSMGDDIREIEIQNRGLQILTANQHSLISELDQLLHAISIPIACLDSLKSDPLETVDSVRSIQDAAEKLQIVLKTKFDEDLRGMRAVQERLKLYNEHSDAFCSRIFEYIKTQFDIQARNYLDNRSRSARKSTAPLHTVVEDNLIKYQGLCLWEKEMGARKYTELQQHYAQAMAPLYERDVKELVDAARSCYSVLKNKNPEELEYIFHEESRQNIALAYGAKLGSVSVGGSNNSSGDDNRGHRYRHMFRDSVEGVMGVGGGSISGGSGRTSVDEDEKASEEAFARSASYSFMLMCREQNFMVDLFQLGPTAPKSFLERGPVFAKVPNMNDLSGRRRKTGDVKISKRILELMGSMFSTLGSNIVSLIDFGFKIDPTYAVSMLTAIEFQCDQFKNSDQEFALHLCTSMRDRLVDKFDKFVEEQVKVIEATKVSTKKRRGILPIFRTFPLMAMRLEKMTGKTEMESQTRRMANAAYEKIIEAMMASLDSIDGESDQMGEEKEKQNRHIMYIENMHHFYHELRTQKIHTLEKWTREAKAKYDEHLNAYIRDSIRQRMLGNLLVFFDGVEKESQQSNTPQEVAFKMQYNKERLRSVIAMYPAKEIKKSLEALYKRVDKHFSEEEGLLQVVWRGIQEESIKQHERMESLIKRCYPDAGAHLEFTTANLLQMMSELARKVNPSQ